MGAGCVECAGFAPHEVNVHQVLHLEGGRGDVDDLREHGDVNYGIGDMNASKQTLRRALTTVGKKLETSRPTLTAMDKRTCDSLTRRDLQSMLAGIARRGPGRTQSN